MTEIVEKTKRTEMKQKAECTKIPGILNFHHRKFIPRYVGVILLVMILVSTLKIPITEMMIFAVLFKKYHQFSVS